MKEIVYDVCIIGGCGHVGLPLGIMLAVGAQAPAPPPAENSIFIRMPQITSIALG